MSTKPSKKESELNSKNHFFEDEIYQALLQKGWVLPQSEEEVRLAEAEIEEMRDELPAELVSHFSLFNRTKRLLKNRHQLSSTAEDDIGEHLARAARDGGEVPPEIEQRMRQDRERAEEEDG